MKQHLCQYQNIQKCSVPPQKHRQSPVIRGINYLFQRIVLHVLGPKTASKVYRSILLVRNHSRKRPALLERLIYRSGCRHSIHTDGGPNFKSQLFAHLLKQLEKDNTRITVLQFQSGLINIG